MLPELNGYNHSRAKKWVSQSLALAPLLQIILPNIAKEGAGASGVRANWISTCNTIYYLLPS